MTFLAKVILGIAFLLAFAAGPVNAAENPRISIQVILDNGGTVTEPGAADQIRNFVGGIANLRGRSFKNAHVDLILTSHPTTVWSGTPRELKTQGRAVLELVAVNDKCADISRALKQADQNLRIAAPDEAYVLIYSPLIQAGFPCDAGPGITLPQPVPQDVAMGRMVDEHQLKALKFYGVHHSQEQVWGDHLIKEGVLARSKQGKLEFQFLGFQQSKTFLAKQRLLSRKD